METYKAARVRLLRELAAKGWMTNPGLKRPWAKPFRDAVGSGEKMFFHAQSVYKGDHSLHLDIRGLSVDALIRAYSFGL